MAKKKVILIIDDDPDIITSIKAMIEGGGFSALTAASGREGVEVAVSKKPDLILCDMMMEKIDAGTKVAEELKSKSPGIPIFLLSSIGDATASNIEVSDLGFNGVFQKPVNPDYLLSTIRKVLGV